MPPPSPCGSFCGRPTLCRGRCPPTCSSGTCRAGKSTWPSWWTSTAAPSGLLTLEDLLEEIVGNIYDEFDPQEDQEIIQLEPNLWRVAGGGQAGRCGQGLGHGVPGGPGGPTPSAVWSSTSCRCCPRMDPARWRWTPPGSTSRWSPSQTAGWPWALVSKLPQGGEEAGREELTYIRRAGSCRPSFLPFSSGGGEFPPGEAVLYRPHSNLACPCTAVWAEKRGGST